MPYRTAFVSRGYGPYAFIQLYCIYTLSFSPLATKTKFTAKDMTSAEYWIAEYWIACFRFLDYSAWRPGMDVFNAIVLGTVNALNGWQSVVQGVSWTQSRCKMNDLARISSLIPTDLASVIQVTSTKWVFRIQDTISLEVVRNDAWLQIAIFVIFSCPCPLFFLWNMFRLQYCAVRLNIKWGSNLFLDFVLLVSTIVFWLDERKRFTLPWDAVSFFLSTSETVSSLCDDFLSQFFSNFKMV